MYKILSILHVINIKHFYWDSLFVFIYLGEKMKPFFLKTRPQGKYVTVLKQQIDRLYYHFK